MSVNPISANIVNLLSTEPVKTEAASSATQAFRDVFSEALNTVEKTDTQDKMSALELMAGQADDMSGLLLDAQKAEIALNLALQMRTKLLEAYNDIMRMQV